MPVLTTDLGEMSASTMVLRSLSLSDEEGGPVQAVGLGEGASLAWLPPSPLAGPVARRRRLAASPEAVRAAAADGRPDDAGEHGDEHDDGDEGEETPAPVHARLVGAPHASAGRS